MGRHVAVARRWREDVKTLRSGRDVTALLRRFAELKGKAEAHSGMDFPIVCIQEAGLDGFWFHRLLMDEGIESHVVDPASIAAPRRRRRAKTDRLDGEALLRALMAFSRAAANVAGGRRS